MKIKKVVALALGLGMLLASFTCLQASAAGLQSMVECGFEDTDTGASDWLMGETTIKASHTANDVTVTPYSGSKMLVLPSPAANGTRMRLVGLSVVQPATTYVITWQMASFADTGYRWPGIYVSDNPWLLTMASGQYANLDAGVSTPGTWVEHTIILQVPAREEWPENAEPYGDNLLFGFYLMSAKDDVAIDDFKVSKISFADAAGSVLTSQLYAAQGDFTSMVQKATKLKQTVTLADGGDLLATVGGGKYRKEYYAAAPTLSNLDAHNAYDSNIRSIAKTVDLEGDADIYTRTDVTAIKSMKTLPDSLTFNYGYYYQMNSTTQQDIAPFVAIYEQSGDGAKKLVKIVNGPTRRMKPVAITEDVYFRNGKFVNKVPTANAVTNVDVKFSELSSAGQTRALAGTGMTLKSGEAGSDEAVYTIAEAYEVTAELLYPAGAYVANDYVKASGAYAVLNEANGDDALCWKAMTVDFSDVELTEGATYVIQGMVWNSMTGLKPIGEVEYITYTAPVAEAE